jgi:folate-binding protein YgfZ
MTTNSAPDSLAPLPHLGLVRVAGTDAESFLQNQLSSDVGALAPGRLQLSSYSSAKGRVLAVLGLRRAEGAIQMETRRELVPGLVKRLRLYVLRSKATLEDLSEQFPALGLWGTGAPDLLAGAGLPVPAQDWDCAETEGVAVIRRPGAQPRFSLHAAAPALERLQAALGAKTQTAGVDAWRLLDIEAGIPAVDSATAEHFVPQMLDLDRVGAISFTKGCYPGQEIVARMHYLGNLKRRLFLSYTDGAAPAAAPVQAAGEAQAVGEVLESAPHPQRGTALLLVLQLAQAGGQLSLAGGAPLAAPQGFAAA